MLEGTPQDISDDLHVAVRVSGEPAAAGDDVVVDDPKGPEAHVLRVVVVSKGERVGAPEPAVIGVAAFRSAANGEVARGSRVG